MKCSRYTAYSAMVALSVMTGVVTWSSSPAEAQTRCVNKCGRYVCIGPSFDWGSCMHNGKLLGCSDAANRKFCAKFGQPKGVGSRALK